MTEEHLNSDYRKLITSSSSTKNHYNKSKTQYITFIQQIDSHFDENATHGWKYELAERLESNTTHIFILILVFLDFLCVMTELVISLT